MKIPLIIAHRGASAVAPENTLSAFRRALKDEADGIECDVRLASDGVPVVIHDATLKRTGLRSEKISELTSRELARIDVGTWFNLRYQARARKIYASETVPTLAQVFEMVRKTENRIYVELKCENENFYELAQATAKLIDEFDLQNRATVKSFEHECLFEIKKMLPGLSIAALFRPRPLRVLQPKKSMIRPTLRLAAEEISLHYSLASRRTIKKAHAANLKTVIWTADHPAWVKRAHELGIYAIITNHPARLLAQRDELWQNEK